MKYEKSEASTDDGSQWIACDRCLGWIDGKCFGLPQGCIPLLKDNFFFIFCHFD